MTQSEMKAKVFVALAKEYGTVLTEDCELTITALKNDNISMFSYFIAADLWMEIIDKENHYCLIKLNDMDIVDVKFDESGELVINETPTKILTLISGENDKDIEYKILVGSQSIQYVYASRKPVGDIMLLIIKEYIDVPSLCEGNISDCMNVEGISSNNSDCTDLNNIIQEVYNEMGCYTLAKSDNK